jgi:hypothetical protein
LLLPFSLSLAGAESHSGFKEEECPMRRLHFALLFLVLVLAAQPLVAVTYYVTHQPTLLCTSSKSPYSIFITIQDAVTQVPAGSTINVCPGTYPEQVVISQPVTLRGVSYGGQSQVVIAMPSTPLAQTSSVYFSSVAAQVQVTAGPVNISNITVDGTAESSNCPSDSYYFGIFYSSGSSGTVDEVEARNQNCNPLGVGIGAENGSGATESVTIENSNTNAASTIGIYACSEESPSTLSASIKSNNITGSEYGILLPCPGVTGSISGNVINAVENSVGVSTSSPATVSGNTVIGPANGVGISANAAPDILDNTIQGAAWGVYLYAAGTITSNHILNSGYYGIYFASNATGATVKSNIITGGPVGIEFNCNANTVSGNTINSVTTGLGAVPASFTGVNKFYNVGSNTTGGGC